MTKAQKIKIVDKLLEFFGGREGAKRWCFGGVAQDKDGNYTRERDKNAVRWCLVGGIRKLSKSFTFEKDLSRFCYDKYDLLLGTYNDAKGRGAVLRLLRSYKKSLEAK